MNYNYLQSKLRKILNIIKHPLLLWCSSKNDTLRIFFFSTGYATFLSCLPLSAFKDRINYLEYATSALSDLMRYWSKGPITVLANEPVWLLINTALSLIMAPEYVLRIIIFIPALIVAFLVLRQSKNKLIWLLFFLFLPQVINSHITHLRQGMAISIFLIGWLSKDKILRWLIISLTPFIHASFFFVLLLLSIFKLAEYFELSPNVKLSISFVTGLCMGGGIIRWGAEYFGARQAGQYDFVMTDVSGLGFIFWFVILIIMMSQGYDFIRCYTFELGTIVFYLSTYFMIEVTARIFESTLIIVLLAGLHLTNWRRQIFLLLITSYGVFQYFSSIDQPWLGFGL